MSLSTICGGFFVVLFAIYIAICVLPNRQRIPKHLLDGPVLHMPGFLSVTARNNLRELTKSFDRIPSTAREYDTYAPLHEHIGEATPYNESLGCPFPYLIPNSKKTHCIFAGRLDVGRHFIRSGGSEGVKESFDVMTQRMFSFMQYLFNHSAYPIAKEGRGATGSEFQQLAKSICPKDQQVLDPFQLNFVIQLPGNAVPTHIDGPYFKRLSRFHVPQWLLVAMVFSGLFEEEFVPQVQVVGYYHDWGGGSDTKRKEEENKKEEKESQKKNILRTGGEFLFWNTTALKPKVVKPNSGDAIAVDGSKTVHAASIYMPERLPPKIPIHSVSQLHWNKTEETWDVLVDGQVIASYPEHEARLSVVYRARCFPSQEAVVRYQQDQKTNFMELEDVLTVFKEDLEKRGISSKNELRKMSRYEFGLKLMETYVQYPLPHRAIIPYNYCALDRLYPWLKPALRLFC